MKEPLRPVLLVEDNPVGVDLTRRAFAAGRLANPLEVARDGEEAFLGAMFQNLGRLLTECYLPEEAVQIRQALGAEGRGQAENDDEQR